MSDNKSDDRIREWMPTFFAIIEEDYGSAPEGLNMDIRLENGEVLWVHRTPRKEGGSGDVEIELLARKSGSS